MNAGDFWSNASKTADETEKLDGADTGFAESASKHWRLPITAAGRVIIVDLLS